ncbi:MAG: hypothetical protein J2P31_00230, partial [Blastocatellia bacterium]|nr:hypothetical protein [Blastocatellia bacterium]
LTQAVYDLLVERRQISSPDPIQEEHVVQAITDVAPGLLEDDGVAYDLIQGEGLQKLLSEVTALTQNEATLKSLLTVISFEANDYATKYIKNGK